MANKKKITTIETPEAKIIEMETPEDYSTLKLKFLKTGCGKFGNYYKGLTYDVPKILAKLFIENKDAEEIK